MVTLGAIFMLYIVLCCVNGSAQPDETAHWLGQRSGIVGGEKPHRFYGECHLYLYFFYNIYSTSSLCLFIYHFFVAVTKESCYLLWICFHSILVVLVHSSHKWKAFFLRFCNFVTYFCLCNCIFNMVCI